MHELSLASSILEIAHRSVPQGAQLLIVRVIAGPMRSIDSDAMQFAWRSVTAEAGDERVQLELDLRPWTLRCPECGCEWNSEQLDCACAACSCNRAFPLGGDELQVVSIQVDEQSSGDLRGVVPCDRYR